MPEEDVATNRPATFLALAHDSRVLAQRRQTEANRLTRAGNEIHCALEPVASLAAEEVRIDQRSVAAAETLERFFGDPRVIQFQDTTGDQFFHSLRAHI